MAVLLSDFGIGLLTISFSATLKPDAEAEGIAAYIVPVFPKRSGVRWC
jgi:hypothetical protein